MLDSISICCCHSDSREDIKYRDQLEKHLSLLIRTQQVTFWHPGKIHPGEVWEYEAALRITTADVILLLLSADFFFSDLCCEQMSIALIQSSQRRASIIPILLRPVDWENSTVGHLEALPKNKKPIKDWRDKDQAFYDVVQSIQSVVAKLSRSPRRTPFPPNEDYKLPNIASIPGVRKFSSEEMLHFWKYMPTSDLRILGKYRLRVTASKRGEIVRHYVPLGFPGLVPVSVSIDTSDCAPKNMTSPAVANLSSGGVEIFGACTEADSVCEVAGNIFIQY